MSCNKHLIDTVKLQLKLGYDLGYHSLCAHPEAGEVLDPVGYHLSYHSRCVHPEAGEVPDPGLALSHILKTTLQAFTI